MARFDKVDSATGNFRALAAADVASENDYHVVIGVGLDTQGRAVLRDAGNSGFVGVTTVDRTKRKAGAILDVMTDGEIVECDGLDPGTVYYLDANGDLVADGTGASVRVGHTVEADRLVVRVQGV